MSRFVRIKVETTRCNPLPSSFHTFFIIVSIDNLLIEHFQISRRFLEILSLNIQPNLIRLLPIPLSRTLRKRKPRSRKRIARPESRDHRAPKTERRRRSKRGGGRLRTERERKERHRGEEGGSRETMTRIPRAVAGSIGECK